MAADNNLVQLKDIGFMPMANTDFHVAVLIFTDFNVGRLAIDHLQTWTDIQVDFIKHHNKFDLSLYSKSDTPIYGLLNIAHNDRKLKSLTDFISLTQDNIKFAITWGVWRGEEGDLEIGGLSEKECAYAYGKKQIEVDTSSHLHHN